jgi:hypothetical protein
MKGEPRIGRKKLARALALLAKTSMKSTLAPGSQSRCATGLRYAPTEAKVFVLLEFFRFERKG